MYGQSTNGLGGNGRRSQSNYQSQRNDNHDTDFSPSVGEQQNSDPQYNDIPEQPTPQASQGSDYACRVIQPDPTKREKLLMLARKEEEEYMRYKESIKSGPIHLTPRKLGGQTSESEARQHQQRTQAQSKYHKMMEREERKRQEKELEEAEIQKKKDIQRRKAEKLEEKRQQQDMEKMERWSKDRFIRNNEFLDQLQEKIHPRPSSFGHSSKWDSDQYEDEDKKPEQSLKWSHEMAVNQAQDEDWMLQQVLKESLITHKIEEETRVKETKKLQHKQPNLQTYRQQQKEEEERKLKEMKDEQRRKAEVLQQHEEEKTQSQEEERRRVNNVFLDKLQRQNTSQHGYSGESNTWA